MAMLIENLENAFNEMFDFITDLPSGLDGFESDFDSAFKELAGLKSTLTQPNAVEVVRCKDCKHAFERNGRKPFGCYLHGKNGITLHDGDDFCSYGERKDLE